MIRKASPMIRLHRQASIERFLRKESVSSFPQPLFRDFPFSNGDIVFVAKNDIKARSTCRWNGLLSGYKIDIHARTDFGKYPDKAISNQDCISFLASPAIGIIRLCTADGVGSCLGAEIASKIACEETLKSYVIEPGMVSRIQWKLAQSLPSIRERINQSFIDELVREMFFNTCLCTTVQVMEINLKTQEVTILKIGDGEIVTPLDVFPDTHGHRTLHVSPFLPKDYKFPFNRHPQAIFTKRSLQSGVYALVTDGVLKIARGWKDVVRSKPQFFVDNLSLLAKKSDVIAKDNVSVVSVQIELVKKSYFPPAVTVL